MSKTQRTLCIATCLSLCICTSCALNTQKSQPATNTAIYVTQSYRLPPFSAIKVGGNSYVSLTDGTPSAFVDVEQHNLKNIRLQVTNNTLYIDNIAAHPMLVKLHANNIRAITVGGQAALFSHRIFTQHGIVTAINHGSITFDGIFDLTKITQQGHGKIEMKWIESKNLAIEANNDGPIYLAGVAHHITTQLTDHAFLSARYLRVKHVEVFATDAAHAEVLPLQTLNAFADKQSNIYYFKRPHHLNPVTRDSGNVFLCDEIE